MGSSVPRENMACTQFSDGNVYFLFDGKIFLYPFHGKRALGKAKLNKRVLLSYSAEDERARFNVFRSTFHSIVLLFHMPSKRSPPK